MAALAGFAAFGTGVIGSPVTMTALTLETTGSFAVTIAALIASTIASLIVRDLFGYSFATWRFHLRGEAIRGPHDVGWMRDLTAPETLTVDGARRAFPLGSLKHFAVVDARERYVGLIVLDDLYTTDVPPDDPVTSVMRHGDTVLLPAMAVREALDVFEASESDALIVVDRVSSRHILGALSESNALRSYGRELERQSPDNVTTFSSKGASSKGASPKGAPTRP